MDPVAQASRRSGSPADRAIGATATHGAAVQGYAGAMTTTPDEPTTDPDPEVVPSTDPLIEPGADPAADPGADPQIEPEVDPEEPVSP
jgi:hypothetical protein